MVLDIRGHVLWSCDLQVVHVRWVTSRSEKSESSKSPAAVTVVSIDLEVAVNEYTRVP